MEFEQNYFRSLWGYREMGVYHVRFTAITEYVCQCFILPNEVFASSSRSKNLTISKSENKAFTSDSNRGVDGLR